jgi:hypothetical protein
MAMVCSFLRDFLAYRECKYIARVLVSRELRLSIDMVNMLFMLKCSSLGSSLGILVILVCN